MERLFERCAALDVHQASVSACVRVTDENPLLAAATEKVIARAAVVTIAIRMSITRSLTADGGSGGWLSDSSMMRAGSLNAA
jgi:hypothetical protein